MKIYDLRKRDDLPYLYEISDDGMFECINDPKDVFNLMCRKNLNDLVEERVYLLSLNAKNVITGLFEVVRGGIDSCYCDIVLIFTRILLIGNKRMVLIHNHPSNILIPSKEDYKTTRKIEKGCELIGIEFLDHIIVSKDGYVSIKSRTQ